MKQSKCLAPRVEAVLFGEGVSVRLVTERKYRFADSPQANETVLRIWRRLQGILLERIMIILRGVPGDDVSASRH